MPQSVKLRKGYPGMYTHNERCERANDIRDQLTFSISIISQKPYSIKRQRDFVKKTKASILKQFGCEPN